jgi:Ca-activated chloride channel family protein
MLMLLGRSFYLYIGGPLLLLLSSLATSHSPGWAQARQQPIRIESALVTVPVIVSDRRGRYVAGLRAEDFLLYHDDEQEQIDLFASSEEPIHLALLLDTSKSTVTVLDKIKKEATGFLRQLRDQDRAIVVSFDTEVRFLSKLSSHRRVLDNAIDRAEADRGNYTRLRDAVLAVVDRFRSLRGRKAVVLLSDGLDFGSQVSVTDLFHQVSQSDLVVYSVHYHVDPREVMKKLFGVSSRIPRDTSRSPRPGDPEARDFEREGLQFMQKLSAETAGRLYQGELKQLKKTLGKVLEELRQQYLLGFYPDKAKLDGKLHMLRIEVSRPDLVVRGRSHYRSSPDAEP